MGSRLDQARKRQELSRKLINLSEGLFAHAFDAALWLNVYIVALSGVSRSGRRSAWWAGDETDRFLEDINYQAIKNAVVTAMKKGLLQTNIRNAPPEITEAGKKRLDALLPRYDEKRVWDGQLHLITYDIPESKRQDRNVLRRRLYRLGCAKLQESVWVTPYNPIDTLRSFIDEEGLIGTVIVSALGKDSSIGEEDLVSLLVRIHRLNELNNRYANWLDVYKQGVIDQGGLIAYLSILKDDPQLPFALLPTWWKGDEAYKKVAPTLMKLSMAMRPHWS